MDPAFGNVDDLFREEESSARTSSRRIDARLDELRRGGCNQKIAWSKLGCIAIINASGTGVETRHLACNPEDGRWLLSDAYPIMHVPRHHDKQKLQHVAWSSPGAELAVVDVIGRVSFYTVFLAVNQLTISTMHTAEHDNDLGSLVGFWWLPIERPYSLHHNAVRTDNSLFKYQAQNYRPLGPFHPVPHKAAAVGITRGGTLKLWYHDSMQRYQEASCELESVYTADGLFSQASISWNKENMAVIAAYTLSQQLRIYRLGINWNIPPAAPNKPPMQFPTAPTFVIQRIRLDDFTYPVDPTPDTCRAQPAHLEVMGPVPVPQSSQPSLRVVMVLIGKTAENLPFSIIVQWELRSSPSALHPSFDQLGVRRGSILSPTTAELELHRLDDIMVDKCVIGIWPVTSGTVIALAFSDGSIDFRDRNTFASLANESPNKNMVTSMIQVGFSFPLGESCLDLALSPNNTVAVRIGYENDMHITVMEYASGHIQGEKVELVCVALALQHAYSCNNFLNNDDLLLIAQKYRNPEFNNMFLTEVHRALNLKMDFAAESPGDRLMRNPLLQRCLSLQYALDFQGERVTKKLSGKLAWATLHLRVASMAFGVTFSAPQRQGQRIGNTTDIDLRPEALQTLLGLVKWFMDMLSMIISDLYDLARATGDKTDLDLMHQKMLESNSPALLLTLASAPRAFLRYNCRSLRGLEAAASKQLQSGQMDEEQKMVFKSFKVPIDSCAIKIVQFERIMTDIDGTIRAAYHNVPEADRAAAERLLFVTNEIPAVFQAPVDRLLKTTLPALRKEVPISALFWTDVTWLGFHDDAGSQDFRRTHRIDAVRKIVLPRQGVRLRRCTRCCSVVEELMPNKYQGFWLGTLQRMCMCAGVWWSKDGRGFA